MNASQSPQAVNREIARKVNEDARSNIQSPYAGKFVGIANGQVVVVADSLDEMTRRLRQAEPDPAKTFWIEASVDYSTAQHVWDAFSASSPTAISEIQASLDWNSDVPESAVSIQRLSPACGHLLRLRPEFD